MPHATTSHRLSLLIVLLHHCGSRPIYRSSRALSSLSPSVTDKLLWGTERAAVDGLNSAERRARAMVHADEASVAARRRYVARPLSANQNAPFAAGSIPGRWAENVSSASEPFLRDSVQAQCIRTLRLLFSLKDSFDQVE